MRRFRVVHDFAGEEEVELSVRKGEVVVAHDNVAQNGWIKVECIDDASRRGFVPLSYLAELPPGEFAAAVSPEEQRPLLRTPSPQRAAGAGRSPEPGTSESRRGGDASRRPSQPTSSTALVMAEERLDGSALRAIRGASQSPPSHYAATLDGHGDPRSGTRTARDESSLLASAPLTPGRASTGGRAIDRDMLLNPSSVVDAFVKNEVYFRQLMRRRADALDKMRDGVADALGEVAACKERNAALTRKLRELDQVIDKERRRWTERVEEEKTFVGRSLAYVPGSALNLGVGGSPSRSGSRQPSPLSGRRSSGAAGIGSSPAAYS